MEKRKEVNASFEKDFFKLLNNSVYSKTIKSLRKRRIHNFKIFSGGLVAVKRIKQSIFMNRQTYVKITILELSKVLIYKFHYQRIKSKYQDKASLLFTDTNSFTYIIEMADL